MKPSSSTSSSSINEPLIPSLPAPLIPIHMKLVALSRQYAHLRTTLFLGVSLFSVFVLSFLGFSFFLSLFLAPLIAAMNNVITERFIRKTAKKRYDELVQKSWPETETVTWLNSILTKLWSNYGAYIGELAKSQINPILSNLNIPAVDVSIHSIDPGVKAPQLSNFKVNGASLHSDENATTLNLAVDFDYESDLVIIVNVKVGLPTTSLKISQLVVRKAQARLKIDLLPNDFRFIQGFSLQLEKTPEIDIKIRTLKVVGVMDIPGLSTIIHSIITSQVAALLVKPNELKITLAEGEKPKVLLQEDGKEVHFKDAIFSKFSSAGRVFSVVGDTVGAIGGGVLKVGEGVGTGVLKVGEGVGTGVLKVGEGVGTGVLKVGEGVTHVVGSGVDKVEEGVLAVGSNVLKVGEGVGTGVLKVGEGVGTGVLKVGEGVGTGVLKVGEGVGTGVFKVGEGVGTGVLKLGHGAGELGGSLLKVGGVFKKKDKKLKDSKDSKDSKELKDSKDAKESNDSKKEEKSPSEVEHEASQPEHVEEKQTVETPKEQSIPKQPSVPAIEVPTHTDDSKVLESPSDGSAKKDRERSSSKLKSLFHSSKEKKEEKEREKEEKEEKEKEKKEEKDKKEKDKDKKEKKKKFGLF